MDALLVSSGAKEEESESRLLAPANQAGILVPTASKCLELPLFLLFSPLFPFLAWKFGMREGRMSAVNFALPWPPTATKGIGVKQLSLKKGPFYAQVGRAATLGQNQMDVSASPFKICLKQLSGLFF